MGTFIAWDSEVAQQHNTNKHTKLKDVQGDYNSSTFKTIARATQLKKETWQQLKVKHGPRVFLIFFWLQCSLHAAC